MPPLYLVLFHVQDDPSGAPLDGAVASAISDNGDWQSITNRCGDVIDPGSGIAGVMLSPGDYTITFSAPGYDARELPVTIVAEGPPIRVGLERGAAVLPPPPPREMVCALQTSLAGLTYETEQFGPIPAWFYAMLNETDRENARDVHLAAGDTHLPIPVSEAYREPGTLWPAALREGYDYAYDLPALRAVLIPVLEDGLLVDMPLAGDGLSVSDDPQQGQYNDPVGKTYGYQWLMRNFERIARGLQGDGTPEQPDLTPYIIFRPGWDGVFYGWGAAADADAQQFGLRWRYVRGPRPAPLTTQQLDDQQMRVKLFGELFRRVLPTGHLAIEHTPGNIPCGEGGNDYAAGGLMRTYDTILSEYNTVHEDSCWQVVGRMVQPYHRPPDQPAGDDPNPPWYLAPGTDRGPYFYVGFEPTVGGPYQWGRGACSVEDVQRTRAYLRGLGCLYTG